MRIVGRTLCVLAVTILSALALSAAPSNAEPWPQRTVRVIVPLPPGIAIDLLARLFAEHLSERWHQSVVVENRPGADGIPAMTEFIRSRDNHTLLFSFAGIITINPVVYDKLPYDPSKDSCRWFRGRQFRRRRSDRGAESHVAGRLCEAGSCAARQAELGGHAGHPSLCVRRLAEQRGDQHHSGSLPRFSAGAPGRG